ncbi:MAG: class I SAM-dependent methyltransferase [Candidatus Woesearchaeota archaeon]
MDKAWKRIYETRALKDMPEHKKSCWTKEGYEQLFEVTKQLIDQITKDVKIKTVLDLGCGHGRYCKMLHEKKYQVTGIDYSAKVIESAKQLQPQINFSVGDGYNLDYGNKSFDLVLSIGTLQCVSNHEKILSELTRVAKKAIIISTLIRNKDIKNPILAFKRRLKEDNWPTREYNLSELIPLIEQAGFKTAIIRQYNNKKIKDGSFIIAIRN